MFLDRWIGRAAELARPVFAPEEPAEQLAALRVVVPAIVLATHEVRFARELAAAPAAVRLAPEGLGWFAAHVPISPPIALAAQTLCAFSALAAMVGLRARPALAVMTLSAFYLFAIRQLGGAVWHDMHLLWMGALLAASPCDEAWAFDGRRVPIDARSARYGVPLVFARLLLGCIYFFPGVHKLHTSGFAWAISDNLRNQLWWKWAEHGVESPWRVDEVPWLLPAGGLFVLAFELSFPLLVMVRATRPWAAVAGLVFHLLAGTLYRIPFLSLWALYVVLVNPRSIVDRAMHLLARLRGESRTIDSGRLSSTEPPPASSRSLVVSGAVGIFLLAGATVQGIRGQMRSYPFACYPTFEWIAGTEMPDLLIEVESPDGRWSVVPHARDRRGYRAQYEWGQIWSLAAVTSPLDVPRLRAYVAATFRSEGARGIVRDAVRARCYRAFVSVVPERRAEPPRRSALLAEFTLPGPAITR
jgi:hypothetical protein